MRNLRVEEAGQGSESGTRQGIAEREDRNPDFLQRLASSPQDSVWVNASAGSGKTTVLAKRVLRLLLSGVRPEKILCLTYTKAAAAEMSIRVMQRLGIWASISDNALNEELSGLEGTAPTQEQMTVARRLFAQALSCPGGLRIRTIHSFAQDVLKRFPVEAGLPPHFSVMDESDARAMQDDALMDALRSVHLDALPESEVAQLGEEREGFVGNLRNALRFLIVELGEKGFSQAMRDALSERARLLREVEEAGSASGYARRLRARLGVAEGETPARFLLRAVSAPALPEDDLLVAVRLLLQDSVMFSRRADKILWWLGLEPSARAQDEAFRAYRSCFLTQDGKILGGQTPKLCSKDMRESHSDLEPFLLREAERIRDLEERLEALEIAEMGEAVLVAGLAFVDRYEARKAARAALDYDDLIAKVAALLKESGNAAWVLYKLDGGVDHILLDEAQDTSRLQWEIVESLTGEFFAGEGINRNGDRPRTLFVVGDEKQSIFSFQKADPESFMRMRAAFSERVRASGHRFSEIPLRVSFRSAPAVLEAVDKVFSSDEARSGVSVAPVRHESFHRGKLFGHVEIWPLLRAPAKDENRENAAWDIASRYEEVEDPQATLADRVAETISGMLARREILPGAARPVSAGDIMILLRQRGRFAGTMVKALKARRIPVTGVDRMTLSEQLAVKDVLALMAFALLPEDDLTLATALKGPLIGIGEENLMELAIGRDGSLWKRLAAFASERGQIWSAAHAYLTRWLNAADAMTPFAMISGILNAPCPASESSGRQAMWTRLGPDALDPLDELLNAALNDTRQHAPSLQGFLQRFFANEAEIKREMDKGGSGGGQVRIMTVHASKGLEAPVVFLPDCGQTPAAQKLPKWHWDEAEGTFLYLPRKPRSGIALEAYALARQKQQEEYKRLLYVALTRAANRLYVAGWESDKAQGEDPSWHVLTCRALEAKGEDLPPDSFCPLATMSDALPDDWRDVGIGSDSESGRDREGLRELPSWAVTGPRAESREGKLMVPSRQSQQETAPPPATATPDVLFARGKIIHRLLQSLPDLPEARREEVARNFLANPRHRLDVAQQDETCREVMAILGNPEFSPLFGADSRAEVPIAGVLADGSRWSGQIDRLCLRDKAVWVVDYKTNRPPPRDARDIPASYAAQMQAYRALLQGVYPERKVRCFLLWTYGPRMMEVPNS